MLLAISSATVALRNSSPNLWNEVLSNLILIKTNTSYERINDKEKEVIITEDNNAHFTKYLQDFKKYFIIGHLGGFCGRQVFPIGETNPKALRQVVGGSQGFRVYDPDGIACTQASQAGGLGAKTGLYINKTVRSGGRGSLTAKHNWDTHLIDGKIRRLTPTECERLMGLPDGWTEGVSDTQRYKLCGNGVVVPVVREIINRLI